MDTLTSGSPTVTKTVTANAQGLIATSGVFGGATLNISYALAGAESDFVPLDGGSFKRHLQKGIIFPGTKLKYEVIGATGSTSLNIETTVPA